MLVELSQEQIDGIQAALMLVRKDDFMGGPTLGELVNLDAIAAALEAAQTERVWQPIPNGSYRELTAESATIQVRADMLIIENRQSIVTTVLRNSVRLCQLVPAVKEPPAPVEAYSHRNGETDEPTVAGWYWFDGIKKWSDSDPAVRRPVLVERESDEPGSIYWYGANDDTNDACADGWLHGKWWGPIVPPCVAT